MEKRDVDWILRHKVTGQENPEDGSVTVMTYMGRKCVLKYASSAAADETGKLTFNGEFVDVGDDLVEYLSVMDEVAENGWSEPFDGDNPERLI